ncbi:Peptidase family M3 [Phycisphaerae bacterium RAS2]|nr:Peptidase family M3 [Phycisphaerae bacterium RAS2]
MSRMFSIHILTLIMLAAAAIGASTAAAQPKQSPDDEFRPLLEAYVKKYKPLYIESATAWWEANTGGSDAAFKRKESAETALVELHADKAVFAQLKALKEGPAMGDPVLQRQLDVMYRAHLPGQADPELQKKIVAIETQVEKLFNTHRSRVAGKDVTENDVRQILSDSKTSSEAEEAWKGYMAVGDKIAGPLKELVKMRNELARKLGFRNFYAMRLALQEIDEAQLLKLFDELDELTRRPFAIEKMAIDQAMAKRFKVAQEELRPWHFGDLFFQAVPEMPGGVNLDDLYAKVDLLDMTRRYYAGMGLEADDILQRSDLYEKPGKSPHAFSTSLDRDQNVRVLCNLKPNLYWADTLVHELGHAVYDKYVAKDVPFLLHEASHSITTEGYAMMMGAMVKNEDFFRSVLKMSPEEAAAAAETAKRSLRREKLIFARWAQVMMRFEHGMYNDPDQDLGKLWWSLKAKYQMLRPPEKIGRPDYAAKIHIVTAPVYYHSYMMGDLFGCQVHHHIATKALGLDNPAKTCFAGRKEAGDYLKKNIFGPGNLYSWNDLTRQATGEPLTAKYFAAQFVK